MEDEGSREALGAKLRRWCTDPGVLSTSAWGGLTVATFWIASQGAVNPVVSTAIASGNTAIVFIAGQVFKKRKHDSEITALRETIHEAKNEAKSLTRRLTREKTKAVNQERERVETENRAQQIALKPHIRHAFTRHLEMVEAVDASAKAIAEAELVTDRLCASPGDADAHQLLIGVSKQLSVVASTLNTQLSVAGVHTSEWRRIDAEVIEGVLRGTDEDTEEE
ncbi:hypothetical protein [Tsukamurella paurometabola]|uniref:hypothetical protein n=1 Tax=Tsukamurella paurometabola TaxID=2061 RepID=UPI0011C0688D|nr:hypothetical protein [Tsukamurella paurometabola]